MVCMAVMMLSGWAFGQNAADAPEWSVLWQSLEESEFESPGKELLGKTNLLVQWGDAVGWDRPEIWEKTALLLNEWELSPDIDTAREKYLMLLDKIGWALYRDGHLPSWESELREYYLSALRITSGPREEGLFLFHLAASLYRSDPYSMDSMRRIEAYLEQAALVTDDPHLNSHVHLLMGDIYWDWSTRSALPEREDALYGSLAVYHYRQCLEIEDVHDSVRARAETALDQLLQEGLRLNIQNRFHPDDDIRVKVSTRNLSEIKVRVDSIQWLADGVPIPVGRIEQQLESTEFDALESIFDQVLEIDNSNQVDWQDMEIRLGEGLTAGWYAVEVSGGRLLDRALLLVTAIDLVVIPRNNGTMTLWAVDAQTAEPVVGGVYHVFSTQASPLYSGRLGTDGLADVVMGYDDTWEEVHTHFSGSPAFIRKKDLEKRSREIPWVVPGAIRVHPGDTLSWAVVHQLTSDSQPIEDTLLMLPDGGALIPKVDQGGVHNQYSVQLPADIDQFGPLYLVQPDGSSTLLAHLIRRDPLPLEIQLSGEQFESDSNLFVSSTPVAVRITPTDTDDLQQPPYIRIIV